jgi:hypothetical protein
MKSKMKRFFLGYENPVNLYEQCPFFAWLIIGSLAMYGIWGSIVVFNIGK